MFDKFKRTNFMEEVTNADDVLEYDFLLTNWDLFEINYPVKFDLIHPLDMQRPDYLSFRVYGESQYWWILCKVNMIDDVWNDMFVGMDIIVPNQKDLMEFYSRVRKRVSNASK